MNVDRHDAPGPCAFCGHPDARHRLWDAIHSRYLAGDPVADIALEYEVSEEDVRQAIEAAESQDD